MPFPPLPQRTWWARLLLSLVAGFGTAIFVGVALTIVDLYLAGHGHEPLGRPWLDFNGLGVHLSRADVVFLVAAALAATLTWRVTAPAGG